MIPLPTVRVRLFLLARAIIGVVLPAHAAVLVILPAVFLPRLLHTIVVVHSCEDGPVSVADAGVMPPDASGCSLSQMATDDGDDGDDDNERR